MKEFEKLISEDRLNDAFNYLIFYPSLNKEDHKDIILLMGQLTNAEHKERLGRINSDELRIIRNRIRQSILELGSKYEELDSYVLPHDRGFNILDYDKFIGMGNEPGWSLKLSSQMIVFVSDYGKTTHAYGITNKKFGNEIWHFRSSKPFFLDGKINIISVTITKENWEDDMSEYEYPYRVEITENFRHYIGGGEDKLKEIIE